MTPERPQPAALSLTRIEDLPALYAKLYCARAFAEWRLLFADKAVVIRLDVQGKPLTMGIDEATLRFGRFAAASNTLEEEWSEVDIQTEGNLATIRAHYRLTSDRDIREGTDLLTVMREGREWRIVCLAYEQTRHTPRPAQSGATHPEPSARQEWERSPNLADLLTKQARQRPNALAIRMPGRELSFGELDRLTWRCTALLAAHGVAAGDAVALCFTDELAGVVSMLATARRGATVWWIPQTTKTLRRQLIADSGARILLSDGSPDDATAFTLVQPDLSSPAVSEAPIANAQRDPRPTAPWLVITGSGSTGSPKKIPITHGQYLAQMQIYNKTLGLVPSDRIASLLSLDSVVKRERFLDAILSGASLALAGDRVLEPIRWLRESAPSLFWTNVVPAEQLLAAHKPMHGPALPSLRAFIVGSSSVSEKLRRRIVTSLSPQLHVYYGMNEVGLVSMARPKDLLASAHTVGYPATGVQLEVLDHQDRLVGPGQTGLVRLRSPGMAPAYLDDAQASRRAFRNGWFHPADLGRIAADGQLDFCGRADHMMILDGTNIFPEEIERILLTHPGVADAAAMPMRHEARQDIPVCAAALEPGASFTEQELLDHAPRENLGFRGPRAVVILDRIPRNQQGKLIRPALAAELTSRLALAQVHSPSPSPRASSPGKNLTFDLIDHAKSTPDAPALLLANGAMSYRQVNEAVWILAQHLHDHNLRAGEVLGLTIEDELTLVLTLLAVIRLGATVFSIPRSATPSQRKEMTARAAIKALATDKPGHFDDAAPILAVARRMALVKGRRIDSGFLLQCLPRPGC